MASSIHIKKATAGSVAHNSRETHSYSVVFPDEKNECSHSSKQAFKEYRQELAIRAKAYQDRTGQKLQKNAITHLSAVVNLEQHHTLADLETIKKEIEKKFDAKVFQMSIHRDEGKLVSKEDEKLVYTSGEDFFMEPNSKELFWDKKFTKKVEISQYDIIKNYHAHIEFLGLDSKGEAIKRNYMSKYNLSQLQTFVAKELQMERGKNYYETKEKAPKRLDVLEFKRANTSKRENTQELVKALEDKYKKEREELKASGAATQKDYQALKLEFEKQKKELESVKSTLATQKTLYTSANERAEQATKRIEELERKAPVTEKEKITELEKEVQELKDEIFDLKLAPPTLTPPKPSIVDSSPNLMSLKAENTKLKKEIEALEWYKVQYQRIVEMLKKLTGGFDVRHALDIIKAKFLQKQQVQQTSLPPKQPLPQERTLPEKGKEHVAEKESTTQAYAKLQEQLDKGLDLKDLLTFNEEHKKSSGYTR